jgi:signal transduction histidine kinase
LFTNIIGNAIKYKKDDTIPEIEIDSRIVRGETLNIPKAKESEYLQITIRDNGIGFDQEYKEKIFDLFQRLHSKENYSGTGIGLAICKKIIQQHNGFIEAESEKGNGSTFKIFLPSGVIIN